MGKVIRSQVVENAKSYRQMLSNVVHEVISFILSSFPFLLFPPWFIRFVRPFYLSWFIDYHQPILPSVCLQNYLLSQTPTLHISLSIHFHPNKRIVLRISAVSRYKSNYKVGLLALQKVKFNVRPFVKDKLWRRAYARNVRIYFLYRQYTNLYISICFHPTSRFLCNLLNANVEVILCINIINEKKTLLH